MSHEAKKSDPAVQDLSERQSSPGRQTSPEKQDTPEWQDSPDWEVSIEADGAGHVASVVLRLSKNGRTIRHRLDAKVATQLSNALIVEAERAQFKAAYRKVN